VPAPHPVIKLKPRESGRILRGHPWIYSNEIEMDAAAKAIEPGAVVAVLDAIGKPLGTATFNRNSLIAARLLAGGSETAVDTDYFAARIEAALALRARFYAAPYYRLVHSEADGVPGLIVDRFADAVVVQANTAGIDRLTETVIAALDRTIAPAAIVLRNDSPIRSLEGLGIAVTVARGRADAPVAVDEEGVAFAADLAGGQKTGWFFDQRPGRTLIAEISRDARVLDLFSHTGGFAIRALAAGAAAVVAIESSEPALALARAAAARNGVAARATFVKGDVFAEIGRRAAQAERYDIVIADPPAFVKSRKGLAAGLKGYRKLARMTAALVAPGGFLFLASCSHLVDPPAFASEVRMGLAAAKRTGRIVAQGGAGPDHPIHPHLPESAYLKWQLVRVD
jgi:23S rRNA (cytosine1962-C5)-methyltransferase